MRRSLALLTAATFLALPACQIDWSERVTGTAVGTAAGAVAGGLLGSAVGSTAGGIILGGIAGGAAGYIIGDWMADCRERAQGCGTEAPPPSPCAAPRPCAAVAPPAPSADAPTGVPVAMRRTDDARAEYDAGRRARTAEEAIAHYDRAIAIDPARPEPHNAKGLVLLYSGRRPEARAEFDRALALDPAYAPATYNLARLSPAR